MNQNQDQNIVKSEAVADNQDRRELLEKLGKFAVYAAPFAALAVTQKASAASGGGPRKHPISIPSSQFRAK